MAIEGWAGLRDADEDGDRGPLSREDELEEAWLEEEMARVDRGEEPSSNLIVHLWEKAYGVEVGSKIEAHAKKLRLAEDFESRTLHF